jgi:hypothetical protein
MTALFGGVPPALVGTIFAVVFVGGLVKGTAGFGYAIVSTAVLAALISPAVAVVVMILPTLVANVRLLGELDRSDLRTCLVRFWPYVVAAGAGTVVGMALLGRVPRPVLALLLGVFTLSYVALTQDRVRLPGMGWVRDRCLRPGATAKVAVGLVSGVVFGASNVAVQVVAYLDSLDLDRSTFVGVLAMILVGISALRLGLAWSLGLFATGDTGGVALVALSGVAAVPGLVGVTVGQRLRRRLDDHQVTLGALALLTLIGAKLTLDGVTAI